MAKPKSIRERVAMACAMSYDADRMSAKALHQQWGWLSQDERCVCRSETTNILRHIRALGLVVVEKPVKK